MHNLFSANTYFVKQTLTRKLLWTSTAFSYDIFDPKSQQQVLSSQEPPLGLLTRLCRSDRRYRKYTPFDIALTSDGAPKLALRRGWTFMQSRVEIMDEQRTAVAVIKQNLTLVSASFEIETPAGEALFSIKGDWADWDFRILANGRQLATISKGDGEDLWTELTTSKDSYQVRFDPDLPADSLLRPLIVAAAIAVDIACNE